MQKFTTNSEQETIDFSEKFGENLKGGEIICLEGNLGAGKTIFSKGLAKGLGYKKNVNSPTFVVMKVYNIENNKIKNLVHIDAYRLTSEKDIETIGAPEYFGNKDSIVIIEWPENIKKSIPNNSIWIRFETINENQRSLTISYL